MILNKQYDSSNHIFLGENEVSDIELYGYGKETKYVKDFMSIFPSECKNYTSEVKNLHRSNPNNNYPEYTNPDKSLGKDAYGTIENVFLAEDEITQL